MPYKTPETLVTAGWERNYVRAGWEARAGNAYNTEMCLKAAREEQMIEDARFLRIFGMTVMELKVCLDYFKAMHGPRWKEEIRERLQGQEENINNP